MTAAKESPVEGRTPLLNKHRPTLNGTEQASLPSIATSSRVTTDDLDARLKRWLDYIARRNPKKAKTVSPLERDPQFLFSVFEKREKEEFRPAKQTEVKWDGFMDDKSFVK